MQLRSEIQIAAMIKAMKDVVIPAVDGDNRLAVEQAQLVVGMLSLMAHQLPLQFRFDRDELQRLLAYTQGLTELRSHDRALGEAVQQLAGSRAAGAAALERCIGDPAQLTSAIRELRQAAGALVTAAAESADEAAYRQVEAAMLELSKEQLLRDRALVLPQGWEPDPTAVPPIETLLDAGAG